MKHRLKKNTAAEQAYIRDLERVGPLRKAALNQSQILSSAEYPEPLKRFISRQQSMLHLRLPPATRKKLEHLSQTTGTPTNELALRWIEHALSRQAS